jgi:hypothetical protein
MTAAPNPEPCLQCRLTEFIRSAVAEGVHDSQSRARAGDPPTTENLQEIVEAALAEPAAAAPALSWLAARGYRHDD